LKFPHCGTNKGISYYYVPFEESNSSRNVSNISNKSVNNSFCSKKVYFFVSNVFFPISSPEEIIENDSAYNSPEKFSSVSKYFSDSKMSPLRLKGAPQCQALKTRLLDSFGNSYRVNWILFTLVALADCLCATMATTVLFILLVYRKNELLTKRRRKIHHVKVCDKLRHCYCVNSVIINIHHIVYRRF